MRHPGVSMILATGGTALVKAAYSSGTPAIGVGSGNAPALICADADLQAAAGMVVASKAFDHGIICGSENNLVVDRSVRDPFVAALRTAGAAVLDAADGDRLTRAAFDDRDGRLRRAVLGQAATAIAAQAGITVPAGTRLLVTPVPRTFVPGPYGREKLAPILSLFTADGQDDGIVVLFQVVPGNVLPYFDVRLDRYAEFDEALDLAIKHVLRKHPVGNPAAIESARFRRLLKNGHFVAEPRQLIRSAMAGRTRPDDGNFLAVGRPGLSHIARQCLSEIT